MANEGRVPKKPMYVLGVDGDGNPIDYTAGGGGGPVDVTDRAARLIGTLTSQGLVKDTLLVAAAGDTTLHVPAAGKRVRLYFFGYSAGFGVVGVLARLKLEGYNGDAPFDSQYLVAAGQPYARNIQAGKRYVEGEVDGALILNLDSAQQVYANWELEEV